MIIDSVRNAAKYYDCIPHMKEAFECLEKNDGTDPWSGRLEFDGGFILLQSGETKSCEEGLFEAHRKYLDVQVLLDGAELIVYNDIADLTVKEPYDGERDREMSEGEGALIEMRPGTFCVLYPADGHKACRDNGTHTSYRKAVIKILID